MKNDNQGKKAIVNMETGEIEKEFEPGSKITLQTPNQVENANKYKQWNKRQRFIKYFDAYFELPDKLTPVEIVLFMKITQYIEYETNRIVFNNEIVNIRRLAELVECDYRNLKGYLQHFYENNIIRRSKSEWDTTTALYINPIYCSRGNRMLAYTINIFKK